jgi:hypothetical protein
LCIDNKLLSSKWGIYLTGIIGQILKFQPFQNLTDQ